MAKGCANGRVDLSSWDRQFLWAASGGHCASPECHANLFASVDAYKVPFGELAHVIPASVGGPRDAPGLSPADRAERDNIILLCANCHSIVDKTPAEFDADRLHEWQRAHMQQIAALFGAIEVPSRAMAHALVRPILSQNRAVFDTYGPIARSDGGRSGPEAARQWRRKVAEVILPNNRRLLAIYDKNTSLLHARELATVEMLRNHVDDMEARHYRGATEPGSVRFPAGVEGIFADEAR